MILVLLADTGKILQAADAVEPFELLARHVLDLRGGAPEGLRLVSGFAASNEQIGDALQRLDGFHGRERTRFVRARYIVRPACARPAARILAGPGGLTEWPKVLAC